MTVQEFNNCVEEINIPQENITNINLLKFTGYALDNNNIFYTSKKEFVALLKYMCLSINGKIKENELNQIKIFRKKFVLLN